MRQILITTFILFSIFCFAQKTKFVTTGNNHFQKEYYVLESDEEIKHGPFLWYVFVPTDKRDNYVVNLLESGRYSHGEKDGQWDYFYGASLKTKTSLLTNNLWQRVVYKNGVKEGPWMSFHLDTIENDMNTEKYKVKKKLDSTVINLGLRDLTIRQTGQYINNKRVGRWLAFDITGTLVQLYDFDQSKLLFDTSIKDSLQYNQTRSPLFLGGEEELRRFILENFDPNTTRYIGRDSTRLIGEFVIKSNGAIDQLNVLKGKATRELRQEITRILQETSGNWLSALSNGEPIDFKETLAIDVFIKSRKWDSVMYTYKSVPT